MFWDEMAVGAFVPGKMKSSPGGMLSQAERGRSKFLESISFCFLLVWGRAGGELDELDCVRRLLRRGRCCPRKNCHHRRQEETPRHLSTLGENVAHHFILRQLRFESEGGNILLTVEKTTHHQHSNHPQTSAPPHSQPQLSHCHSTHNSTHPLYANAAPDTHPPPTSYPHLPFR
jgi:hypothetical protein